jgi:hypothetical protein
MPLFAVRGDAMKQITQVVIASFLLSMSATAKAGQKIGVVALRIKGCDYYPVITKGGITILEWYEGYDPDQDDKLVGEIESYGMKGVVFLPNEHKSQVWVEDYWLSPERAMAKLRSKCNLDD